MKNEHQNETYEVSAVNEERNFEFEERVFQEFPSRENPYWRQVRNPSCTIGMEKSITI